MEWAYNESDKQAIFCLASANDPPVLDDGSPWPCHNVPAREPLPVKTFTIDHFNVVSCPRMDHAPSLNVTYSEVRAAMARKSYLCNTLREINSI